MFVIRESDKISISPRVLFLSWDQQLNSKTYAKTKFGIKF